jgi:hypothetical protein
MALEKAARALYVNVCYIRIPKEGSMSCGYRSAMAADGMTYTHERAPFFRSGWEIAAMVGGFIVFFPIGLAILGYLIWRKKMHERGMDPSGLKGELKRWKREMKAQWKGGSGSAAGFSGMGFGRSSGNTAFDDYRSEVLRRLEEERRKLDDEQRAFGDFMVRLRRAKDQEEFDRFMAERGGSAAPGV